MNITCDLFLQIHVSKSQLCYEHSKKMGSSAGGRDVRQEASTEINVVYEYFRSCASTVSNATGAGCTRYRHY